MSTDLFLCLPCGKGGEEKGKTPLVERRECDYCGALCQNMPVPWGQRDPSPLPRGAFITADSAPPPRALSRAEVEAQVRPAPEPSGPRPNPFLAPVGQGCGETAECGGACSRFADHSGGHACHPDRETGEETCPA